MSAVPVKDDQAGFAVRRAAFVTLAGSELHDLEADVRPAGGLRRDFEDASRPVRAHVAGRAGSCRFLQAGLRAPSSRSVREPDLGIGARDRRSPDPVLPRR